MAANSCTHDARFSGVFGAVKGCVACNFGKSPLHNVWLGVSCERQQEADERIPWLLKTPAAVRFLSCEPLLGPINLQPHIDGGTFVNSQGINCDWVIVGGESGPGARPMHPEWARSLRDQCQAAGVPFFFKQWGEWYPIDERQLMDNPSVSSLIDCGDFDPMTFGPAYGGQEFVRVGKKPAGRLLDGREWSEYPKEVAHA